MALKRAQFESFVSSLDDRQRELMEAALDSLNAKLPDLVIADFHLPGMNGDELTRQMRLNVRTRAIPVIMLTEARERAVERQGLESGADAYISKSAEQELIILRIRALLRRRSAPVAVRSRTARSSSASSAATMRSKSCSANWRASSRPIPLDAPVTRQVASCAGGGSGTLSTIGKT